MIELIYMLIALGFFLDDKPDLDETEKWLASVVVALFWPVVVGVRVSKMREVKCAEEDSK